jgi:hypothetical protein
VTGIGSKNPANIIHNNETMQGQASDPQAYALAREAVERTARFGPSFNFDSNRAALTSASAAEGDLQPLLISKRGCVGNRESRSVNHADLLGRKNIQVVWARRLVASGRKRDQERLRLSVVPRAATPPGA